MKVILSGAAGVLGEAVRQTFSARGAKIACIARGKRTDDGTGCAWFDCTDLADEAAAQNAVLAAHHWLGGLDALIHVAGAFEWKRIEDSTLDDWRVLYRANVETTFSMAKACLPYIDAGGAIVAVGAASAEPAGEGMGGYGGSKSAVARLVEALAIEIRPRGLRVNAVMPSIIDTPRNRADMPDADHTQWTRPDAIADTIHFLATPASRATSGALIPVTNNG